MKRATTRFSVRLLGGMALAAPAAVLGGCEHHDVAMRGTADGVAINYVGDVADTLPLARQHCAQYERQPVLRQAKDNTATYACVRVNAAP